MHIRLILFLFLLLCSKATFAERLLVGTYYFDGWSGMRSSKSAFSEYPEAPTHLTKKLFNNFSERMPIWGWRDDEVSIMEHQIDLASENGIDFFMFCWYFSDNKGAININKIESDALHTSIQLFMKARNKHKMKFAVMITNHSGSEIIGKDQWIATMEYLSTHYFNDPQYLKVNDCPVVEFYVPTPAHDNILDLRNVVKKNGYEDLCFFSCGKFFPDAQINGWYNIREKESGISEERNYTLLTSHVEKCWYWKPNNYNVIPVVMAGWDKRPWENKESSLYYTRRSPKLFKNHFEQAVKCIQSSHPKIPMIMIYAWNEIGEGGYLVPTLGDPKAQYLKQIKKVRKQYHQ